MSHPCMSRASFLWVPREESLTFSSLYRSFTFFGLRFLPSSELTKARLVFSHVSLLRSDASTFLGSIGPIIDSFCVAKTKFLPEIAQGKIYCGSRFQRISP